MRPFRRRRTGITRANGWPRLVMTIPSSGRSSNRARHSRRNSVTLRSFIIEVYTDMYTGGHCVVTIFR